MALPRTTTVDQRAVLERLLRERREGYAALSRLIGKNAAYIQQFIKRGTPTKLDEEDRKTIAHYLGVSDAELGGDEGLSDSDGSFMRVFQFSVRASAGHGAINDSPTKLASMGFDPSFLRTLGVHGTSRLSIISVQGDSMMPTLADGDEILVNQGDAAEQLRDGIYVLGLDEALMVKRVALGSMGSVTILSDNTVYPEWRDCDLSTIRVIGRVIWAGRKVG